MRFKSSSHASAIGLSIIMALCAHQRANADAGRPFVVDTSSSRVAFLMKAPIENIHGVATRAVHGELTVDPHDLSATRGEIRIDLDRLEVFQSKLDEESGAFAPETKSEKQNEDMKAWFEISDDAPAQVRERNRWVVFEVQQVSAPSENDLGSSQSAERKARVRISGSLSLHGHQSTITSDVDLSFGFVGDELKSVRVSSVSPVPVSLEHYDVRPRSAFEKLAAKTLGALGQKVAESAPVTFSFTLTPR